MAKGELYNVYDENMKIMEVEVRRNDLARITGCSYAAIDEKVSNLLPGFSTRLGRNGKYIVQRAKPHEKIPDNPPLKKLLATGIWEETCRPFRKLSERRK